MELLCGWWECKEEEGAEGGVEPPKIEVCFPLQPCVKTCCCLSLHRAGVSMIGQDRGWWYLQGSIALPWAGKGNHSLVPMGGSGNRAPVPVGLARDDTRLCHITVWCTSPGHMLLLGESFPSTFTSKCQVLTYALIREQVMEVFTFILIIFGGGWGGVGVGVCTLIFWKLLPADSL